MTPIAFIAFLLVWSLLFLCAGYQFGYVKGQSDATFEFVEMMLEELDLEQPTEDGGER